MRDFGVKLQGLGLEVWGLGSGFRVLGVRVWVLGVWVLGFGEIKVRVSDAGIGGVRFRGSGLIQCRSTGGQLRYESRPSC